MNPANAAGLHRVNIPLDTDFGHNPVGQLGQSQVKKGTSPGKKLQRGFEKMISNAKNLSSRKTSSNDAMKFRKALEKTSQVVGELIGALSKTSTHQVDGMLAQKLIGEIGDATQPMRDMGADYSTIFEARVKTNLTKMTTQQLLELKNGLALTENSALKGNDHLGLIKGHVTDELTQRLNNAAKERFTPIIEKACGEVSRYANLPGAVGYEFEPIFAKAMDVLREHGMPCDNLQARALVKDVINGIVEQSPQAFLEIGQMVGCLPSQILHDLAHTPPFVEDKPPFDLERVVTGAIGRRMEVAESGFLEGVEALLNHEAPFDQDPKGIIQNPASFARELVNCAKHLEVLQKHGDIHDLKMSDEVDLKLAVLLDHLDNMLSCTDFNLGDLSGKQLKELEHACDLLQIQRARGPIVTEISRRMEQHMNDYAKSFTPVINAVNSRDQAELLCGLMNLKEAGDLALQRCKQLDPRLDDAQRILEFRANLLRGPLNGLPEKELNSLMGGLLSRDLRSLKEGLNDVASLVVTVGGKKRNALDDQHRTQLFDVANTMDMLEHVTRQTIEAQKVKLPELPDDAPLSRNDLSSVSRQAILDVFHIGIDAQGGVSLKSGRASASVQQTFEHSLREPLSDSEKREQLLPSGLRTGVADTFWRDLGRASYEIHTGEEMVPMLDRTAWSSGNEVRKNELNLQAAERLLKLCDGDEEMAMFISQYAHQGLLAGLQQGVASPNSPLRLPDGNGGHMMGQEEIRWTFSRGDDGSIALHCDYQISNATMFMNPANGEITNLDPQTSHAKFNFEVTFHKDRSIEITAPVSFEYDIAVL